MKTLRLTLRIVLGIAIPLSIQLWHRRYLTPARRACAWNVATWGAALYAFGPFSLLGWFWVTRWHGSRRQAPVRAAGAIVLGIGAMAAASGVIFGIDQLVAAALGLPP